MTKQLSETRVDSLPSNAHRSPSSAVRSFYCVPASAMNISSEERPQPQNYRVEFVLRQCTAFWQARCRGRLRIWGVESDSDNLGTLLGCEAACKRVSCQILASRVFPLIPSMQFSSLSLALSSTLLRGTRIAPRQRTYCVLGRTAPLIHSDPGSGFEYEPQNPLSSSLWRQCLPQEDDPSTSKERSAVLRTYDIYSQQGGSNFASVYYVPTTNMHGKADLTRYELSRRRRGLDSPRLRCRQAQRYN
ncbi:hypothetical protein EV421DRAFT_942380 [Armillaria borealis]|uniref:Uncharacterized protein n=1 Tax=Armillaria borealis TaxID=47425 RepID=A0AA39JA28_9AGAR|nr:hypothetical protein EV421DRAFT_942380 [Armillaria borealis]